MNEYRLITEVNGEGVGTQLFYNGKDVVKEGLPVPKVVKDFTIYHSKRLLEGIRSLRDSGVSRIETIFSGEELK